MLKKLRICYSYAKSLVKIIEDFDKNYKKKRKNQSSISPGTFSV